MFRRMVNLVIVLSICLLLTGCTVTWKKQFLAGTKGAVAKIYGKLESGQVLYKSDIGFSLGCWGRK